MTACGNTLFGRPLVRTEMAAGRRGRDSLKIQMLMADQLTVLVFVTFWGEWDWDRGGGGISCL